MQAGKGKDDFSLSAFCIICGKARSKQRCCRLSNPLPACLPGWLPLPEPQYFTAIVSAIDSAVNPTPHPWKRFRILIPLTPPVHLNLNAFCKQDFMHDLLPPPSLLPQPSLSLPLSLLGLLSLQRIRVEMASALVGSENVQCTIVAMEQADRQAALPPSLACLPDSPALDSFMCSLFLGLWEAKHSARGKIEHFISVCFGKQ